LEENLPSKEITKVFIDERHSRRNQLQVGTTTMQYKQGYGHLWYHHENFEGDGRKEGGHHWKGLPEPQTTTVVTSGVFDIRGQDRFET